MSSEPSHNVNEIAIAVKGVSKKFRLFSSTKERLLEALHPFKKEYHKEYWALKNISFEVYKGEVVGIIGKNGSGKSTLLQIICSIMHPSSGNVKVNGKISALLELGAGFNPEFTGRENAILYGNLMGFSSEDMLAKIDDIEKFADIGEFFDQPVKTYSSGMFVRVAFSAAIHIDPEILIVDEALSVGDSKFQHRCFQKIRSFVEQGKTILVVSHSTDTLLRICTRGVVMNAGDLVYVGAIDQAVNCYHNILFGSAETKNPENDKAQNDEAIQKDVRTVGTDDIVSQKYCYNQYETRLGNGKVKIIDFEISVGNDTKPFELKSGEKIELTVKLLFTEDVYCVSAGFAIVTVDGLYAYGTNMNMMRMRLLDGRKGDVVFVKFEFLQCLVGGEYFLNLGCNEITESDDVFLDIRRSVAKIKCSDTPMCVGMVNIGTQVSIF